MIYESVQDVQLLKAPELPDWQPAKGTALAAALERRAALLQEQARIQAHAAERRAQVEAELAAAERAATVTADSSPVAVATAELTLERARPILAEIEQRRIEQNFDLQRRLTAVKGEVDQAALPLTEAIGKYNGYATDYLLTVKMFSRSGTEHSHALWIDCQEQLALLALHGEYVRRAFRQVMGREYRGEWGELFPYKGSK